MAVWQRTSIRELDGHTSSYPRLNKTKVKTRRKKTKQNKTKTNKNILDTEIKKQQQTDVATRQQQTEIILNAYKTR